VAALSAALLGGCGVGPLKPVDPDPGGARPVVTPRQALQILGTLDATLVRAAASKDVTQFGGRVVGPEQQLLAASYQVLKVLQQPAVAPPAPNRPRLLLPTAGAWPRWFLAAGASPATPTPVLRVMWSQTARTPYGLWSQLELLPGATLPDVAESTVGATPLAPDSSGLVLSPATVLAHYTELLNRGDASAYGKEFAADEYRSQLNQQLKTDRAAFASKDVGVVLAEHTLAGEPVFALATLDGGALVIGRVDQKYSVTVAPGKGSVRLDQQLAALAGRQLVTKKLDRTAVETLAFYVPRAGGSTPIALVAASKADVAATGS
jgi:hypothetical protein